MVIHSVGAITDAFNYKRLFDKATFEDPLKAFQTLNQSKGYSDSLEALNRDSVKLLAEHYIRALTSKKGLFVFVSAEPSILPGNPFWKYARTKQEAEQFLE